MTISFRSQANAAGATSSTCVVNLPAGTVAGDLMFALFQSTFATGAGPVNTLSGWTALASYTAGYPDTWLFYRVAGGSEPGSYTWSVSNGDGTSISGAIVSYQGGPTIDVAGAAISHSATGTNTVASITTANSGVLVLLASQRTTTGLGLSTPSGFAQQMDVNPNAGCELGVYDKTFGTGATGTVTQTGSSFGIGGILVQLYVPADNGTAAWTEANDVNAATGVEGNPVSGSISSTEQNDTFGAYQTAVTIQFGVSPSYIDNGQDGVSSWSASLTGTPVATTMPAYPTVAITDNSGNSPYITLRQQGFDVTTGSLDGNSGFAWPGSTATPTEIVGSIAGTVLTVVSVTGGGAIIIGHQIAVGGSTLAGTPQITANLTGSNTGASTWTITNPSSVTEPASTTMTLSKVGGLAYDGQYFVQTSSPTPGDAGIFSDAQQSTGTSQLVVLNYVDGSAFGMIGLDIAPEPKFSVSSPTKIYVKATGYTGSKVTVAGNALTTTGATVAVTQTMVHTAGQAFQAFSLYGFNNLTSVVLENTGFVNGNVVSGSASNSPPYQVANLKLVPSNPNFANLNWTETNDAMVATGTEALTGSSSTTESNDVTVAAGALTDIGTIATTESNDINAMTGTASGAVDVSGTIIVTEQNDTNNASGIGGVGVSGTNIVFMRRRDRR